MSRFYKHAQMADGHVNKCKTCNKIYVRQNRKKNVEYYRAYDRDRGNRQTPDYAKEYKAHTLINNAVRDGKLRSKPCEICLDVCTHAHHDDYNFPLEVRCNQRRLYEYQSK